MLNSTHPCLKRDLCRNAGLLVALTCLLVFSLAQNTTAADVASRPNIVIVMVDDMGFSDLGCYGGEIKTPNIDRLAAGGLRFSQFYNTARCCPTRAALLTGLYSHQAGIGHMTGNYGMPSYQGFLNDRCVTIAEALRPAGYATLMTGKWHVGSAQTRWPLGRGFDRYFGTPSGGGVYFKGSLKIRKNVFFVDGNDRVALPDDFYVTKSFTDYAMKYVDEAVHTKKPFFLYLAHIAPHWPLQAKPEDIQRYQGWYDKGWDKIRAERFRRQHELGLFDNTCQMSPRDAKALAWDELEPEKRQDLSQRMSIYAAQIDSVDQHLGRLVAQLRQLRVLDNTLILFLSDNGCSAEGGPGGFSRGIEGAAIGTAESYASVGLEWANVADTPLRKFKMSTYEGGISTPLIAHWPAGIQRARQWEREPGHVVDLLPTCLDVAGVSYPRSRNGKPTLPVAGRSLRPAFEGKSIDRDALFWEHEGNRAIRAGRWKLVAAHNQPWELYDLVSDRTELVNLVHQHSEMAEQLETRWQAWAKESGVQPWPVKRVRKKSIKIR